ncbi:MAG TPA: MFS transporter [Thermoanaerobaculia bacterium]|jgi:MFS family permease|nr:MFS transporter [Thermoanaerobaculia bacterium]
MSEKERHEQGSAHPAFLKPAGPSLGMAPPRGEMAPRRGMFSSLAHPDFRRYWIGLFLSNIGTWMQVVAQGWLVLRLSDSALMLGLVGFAGSIPTLLLAPLAGVAADRLDRRKLLLATQSTQLVCALVLAVATGLRFVSVPLVGVVAIVNGLANAFTMPSHQSLFLDLVGREDLLNAISLNSMQFNLSRVIGPMVAGLTIAAFGETGCFLLNAVSYLAVIAALLLLPSLRARRGPSHGAWIDLRVGIRFARRRPLIVPLLAIAAALAVFGTPAVTLAPLFARRLLHVGPEGLGGMLSAVGLGAAASALLIASRGDFRNKGRAVVVCALGFAAALLGLGLSRRYVLSLGCLALLGASMSSSASLINTLLQTSAPDRLRGRVISLYALAWLGLVPIGNLQAGAVAERFGAAAALFVGAAGIVLTLLTVQLVKPIPGSAA